MTRKTFLRTISKIDSQPEVSYLENIEIPIPEHLFDKEIETNSSYQEAIEQEYNKPTEKHYRDSPKLKEQMNTSKVVFKFLEKQIDLNKVIKL